MVEGGAYATCGAVPIAWQEAKWDSEKGESLDLLSSHRELSTGSCLRGLSETFCHVARGLARVLGRVVLERVVVRVLVKEVV